MEVTEALRRHRGWGRFNLELARALATRASGADFHFFYHADEGRDDAWLRDVLAGPNSSFHPIRLSRAGYDALGEGRGESYLDEAFPDADVYHSVTEFTFHVRRLPKVTTIHEISPLLFPDRFGEGWLDSFRAAIDEDLRTSKRVATVSRATRDDLIAFCGADPTRVHAIPNGVSARFFAEEIPPAAPDPPVLLYVGPLTDPLKGFDSLWEAFRELPAEISLSAIAGDFDEDRFRERYRPSAGERARLRVASDVSDAELLRHYRAASLLVFPSLHEGFGLPVAEAMAVGLPVLCHAHSGPREIAGDRVHFVGPGEPLAVAIVRALRQRDPGEIARARERAAALSWENAAASYLRLYELACGAGRDSVPPGPADGPSAAIASELSQRISGRKRLH